LPVAGYWFPYTPYCFHLTQCIRDRGGESSPTSDGSSSTPHDVHKLTNCVCGTNPSTLQVDQGGRVTHWGRRTIHKLTNCVCGTNSSTFGTEGASRARRAMGAGRRHTMAASQPLVHPNSHTRIPTPHANNLSTRCILGDIQLWVVDPSTFSCLVSIRSRNNCYVWRGGESSPTSDGSASTPHDGSFAAAGTLPYRGTLLIGPYSRHLPRKLWRS
jgi:hypothetical protein